MNDSSHIIKRFMSVNMTVKQPKYTTSTIHTPSSAILDVSALTETPGAGCPRGLP